MFIKKNGAVISVIVLLLFVAVYLNWQYSRGVGTNEVSDVELGDTSQYVSSGDDSQRFDNMNYTMEFSDSESALESGSASDGYIVTDVRYSELSTYFDETRLDRQQTRDEAINLLQSTLADDESGSEVKTAAEESIAVLASNAVAESRIESLIMAKGFMECVAIIDDTGVNVVVLPKEEGLEAGDVSKIKDIILSQTSVSADMIRVIEAK